MTESKIKDGFYKIRPAGRHIITIGRDLIKDKYAAIVELVKNAYDADSAKCIVSLKPFEKETFNNGIKEKGITISIRDFGHGMPFDIVTDKWMVPSTDDKLHRVISPKGRLMQGKKGIGRYSASMLGDDLVLQTIDKNGELTTLYLIWKDFEEAKYLNDVDVLIENFETKKESGTEIVIVGDETHLNDWDEKQLQKLKFELKKLISPIQFEDKNLKGDKFQISLELGGFPFDKFSNTTEDIEPYPLFNLFDYRISGTVSKDGIADLKFENQRANTPVEDIRFTIPLNNNLRIPENQSYCGTVKVDFTVFDRDPLSINGLIERGLKDPSTNNSVGKREARHILDSYCGIGVFRNGFRIRPLGDPGFDWLNLDNERVQNPSVRVGSDQVIGFMHVESEDKSGLIEKSARDGLKENSAYYGLMNIAINILKQLETRRFSYRQSVGLGRSNRDVNEKINRLYNFKDLSEKINTELNKLGIEKKKREGIDRLISDKEKKNNQIANELKEAIALYQGQATVGKIVNVVLHEGRKPLGYFKNQIPMINEWAIDLQNNYSKELLDKICNRLTIFGEQGNLFIKLFGKLDPLSAKKRDKKKDFNLREVIETVQDVFHGELETKKIEYNIECTINQTIFGWKEDFYVALTNLVDNSIYWLQQSKASKKQIFIKAFEDDENIILEYRDNGPGIKKNLIETEIIFEPEFSDKPGGGTGLGLAIAGEAIERNDGTLKAIYSDSGAFFKLEVKIK